MTAKEANTQKYTEYAVSDVPKYQILFSFIFKVPVEKVVTDEEKLHGIKIDGILNLKNLSRTVFID